MDALQFIVGLIIFLIFSFLNFIFARMGYYLRWRNIINFYLLYFIIFLATAFYISSVIRLNLGHHILQNFFIFATFSPFLSWLLGLLYYYYQNRKFPEDEIAKRIKNSFQVKKDGDGDDVFIWESEARIMKLSTFILLVVVLIIIVFINQKVSGEINILLNATILVIGMTLFVNIIFLGRFYYMFGCSKDVVGIKGASYSILQPDMPFKTEWKDILWYKIDDKSCQIKLKLKSCCSSITLYCLEDSYQKIKRCILNRGIISKDEYIKRTQAVDKY